MGLFSRVKKQLLTVIEWKDSTKDTIVYRYPLTERDEIMNSSTLVVRPSQVAIFLHKGQVADIFAPGTYKLATENIPIITKILSLPTGFNSPIKAEVYFINTKQFTGIRWGTQNPIMMRDKDYGNIRIRGFGIYAFKVDDAKMFMEEMFGTNELYKVDDVIQQMQPMLIQSITDSIATSKISALDLAANYKEFSDTVSESSKDEFCKYGLKLTSFIIENISVPDEIEKALDERTKLGLMEDKMGTYTQYQAAQAMRDAAKNEGGNSFAGLGIGLGAGSQIGGIFGQAFSTENKPKTTTAVKTKACVKCGAEIKESAKYCPECGAVQGRTCPKCGVAIMSKNAKFCPDCGASLIKKCAKCGAELKTNAKFCPECGEKI